MCSYKTLKHGVGETNVKDFCLDLNILIFFPSDINIQCINMLLTIIYVIELYVDLIDFV